MAVTARPATALLLLAWLAGCGQSAPPAASGAGDGTASGIASGAGDGAPVALPADRPLHPRDVVLIVVDTQRADRLGCYGFPCDVTPEMDGYARAGVRVADVTSQSSWTAPSMVSLMLSRHVADNFVRMPPQPTLAERLRAAGYRTAAFVDNVLLAPGTGFDRGFDSYAIEPGPKIIVPEMKRDDGRPLFAYFHFVDPHDPYRPLPSFDIVAPEPLPAPMREALLAAARERRPDADAAALAAEVDAAAAEMSAARARYAGDVRQADQRVHFVREVLAASGRAADALVVIAADHGECLWEHREAEELLTPEKRASLLTTFKMTHNSVLFEELLAVPLIFSGAGLPAGTVLPGPAQNVDIVPTILDLLGLPVPVELQGRSLLPAMLGHAAGARGGAPQGTTAAAADAAPDTKAAHAAGTSPVLCANSAVFTSVRDERGWKLIVPWDDTRGDHSQLFDLRADPGERHPIALPPQDGEARAAAERLARAVHDYRATGLHATRSEDVIDAETRERMEQLGYLGK
ncbi:MAG TPA: sulfatase [Planctomycetota bacterium]|nr:sulfatase [Planctomycetota bacterium]